MKFRSIVEFVKATGAELAAAFTGAAQIGYRTDGTEGFVGRVGATDKRFLMEGDIVATAPASETQTGVTQLANDAEFAAGTNDDGSGNPLVAKPSQIKAALDSKIQSGGDIDGTNVVAPLVVSSTQNSGLLVKNVAGSQQGRIKATGAAELSLRDAADAGYASLQTGDHTVNGNMTVTGSMTVQGTVTSLNTTDTEIKDNIITLNKGEVGSGVSLGEAGISIDRGAAPEGAAKLVFNESEKTFKAGLGATLLIVARKAIGVLGAAATSHVFTHNLNTKDVRVSVYDGDEEVYCGLATSTVNTITLTFAIPVTGYRVVVIG